MPTGPLDNIDYYKARKRAIEAVLLLRRYYAGNPYSSGMFDADDQGDLWRELLQPDEDIGKSPIYTSNEARLRIDTVVGDVFPADTRLVAENQGSSDGEPEVIDEEELNEFFERYVDLGPTYERGLPAFYQATRDMLGDCAQSGDGLDMIQYLGDEKAGRLNFMPYEAWDYYVDPVTKRRLFFRIEYILAEGDKEYMRRWDIYRDRIVRYAQIETVWSYAGKLNPPPDMRPLALSPLAAVVPPDFRPAHSENEFRQMYEDAFLKQLDGWICVPMYWQRLTADDLRGSSELLQNELGAIDDLNRLLQSWKTGAHAVGNPTMFVIDGEMPGESGGENRQLTSSDIEPGAVIELWSQDDGHQAKPTYAENQPTSFPHSDVLEAVRRALHSQTPMLTLDPKNLAEFSRLSSFARDMLNDPHLKRVHKIRESMLTNGRLLSLRRLVAILDKKEVLEGSKINSKTRFKFEYGGRKLSPDEFSKWIASLAILQKMGLPPREIVALLPFSPQDRRELLASFEKTAQAAADAAEALANRAAAGPGGTKPPAKATDGQDKRTK